MLNDEKNVAEIARNQYSSFLGQLSKEALLDLAKKEHGLEIVPDAPKRVIIEKILRSKYGA